MPQSSTVSIARTVPIACLLVCVWCSGCRSEQRVPTATQEESRRASDAPEGQSPGLAEGVAGAEEIPAESEVKRGTRQGGGFLPPIRRPDSVASVDLPASEQFVFGGDASASYYVEVENLGLVPVSVIAKRGFQRIAIGRASSGDRLAHRFQAADTVVVSNTSTTDEARVKIRVWGDAGGRVRYERADGLSTGE